MDSDRFDRWAKVLALRISRRTAATAVGAAAVVSLTSRQRVLGDDVCLDVVACKRYKCNQSVNPNGSGDCSYQYVGDIPGGPYVQEWQWMPPRCVLKNHTDRELEALCNQAFPGDAWCNNECGACATASLLGCA